MTRQNDLMNMARAIAKKATCPKRQVGCVITNHKDQVLSIGYNSVPKKEEYCIDNPCSSDMKDCHGLHAEANAIDLYKSLMHENNDIHTIYVTLSPCINCAKLICDTSCQKVIYLEDYKNSDGIELLRKNKIEVIKYE